MTPDIRVTTARQAAARDAAAIAAGVPSRALMQRAGAAAAGEMARRWPSLARGRIAVLAGAGNNGGDAWVVARALAAAGARVRVTSPAEPRTPDALAERALARGAVEEGPFEGAPLVVDGLLGTGARGAPRGEIAALIAQMAAARANGAVVVALDVPSGLDADGAASPGAAEADLTLTFGTIKRGLLCHRDRAGAIALLDIGLGRAGEEDGAPGLVTAGWVRARLPRIAADAHKGTRRKLVVIGGQTGMAGAPIIAARAAMRSGIGMVRVIVAPENLALVPALAPHALARSWDDLDGDARMREAVADWADALLLGPGLGVSERARSIAERALTIWRGPVVLDADGLNIFAGRAPRLGELLDGRPAVITPHAAEFARLAGFDLADVLARHFDAGSELARVVRSVVLLKGVPTVVSGANGTRMVSAAGTPVLAAAGSGDLLSGVAATLVAQMDDPLAAAACAAWAHGRAGELAQQRAGGHVRGVSLEDVEGALAEVWALGEEPVPYPVLAELPAVGS